MPASLRQRWDTVNDCPSTKKPDLAAEERLWQQANAAPVPEYRAKLVLLPSGQSEVSVTPANKKHVIDLRMGFNPLLDCPRKLRTLEEQEERDIENRQRSSKRAKQRVRYLVKSITADHMLTFSYRENMTDRERAARDWKEFLRLFHQRYPDWKYIAVLEEQERGAIHLHVAVQGKQDIKWLLRCWLLAIGQPHDEVQSWHVHGIKLGDKSLGAVNVEPPKKRWGGASKQWKRDKLAGYLTKYIGKEFEETAKGKKKYWHSKNIEQPKIHRFWLNATTWEEAVREAYTRIKFTGATRIDMWGDYSAGVVWIQGDTDRDKLWQVTECDPDLEPIGMFDYMHPDYSFDRE